MTALLDIPLFWTVLLVIWLVSGAYVASVVYRMDDDQ